MPLFVKIHCESDLKGGMIQNTILCFKNAKVIIINAQSINEIP